MTRIIEIFILIGAIMLFVFVFLPRITSENNRAAMTKTVFEIQQVLNELTMYHIRNGSFPKTKDTNQTDLILKNISTTYDQVSQRSSQRWDKCIYIQPLNSQNDKPARIYIAKTNTQNEFCQNVQNSKMLQEWLKLSDDDNKTEDRYKNGVPLIDGKVF
ncbi:hypothetical protein [Campylobacter fetus]|uniref:hypothetical protein n=1 Tax=Campylobacter fetus TaxID=196 RepID=UPI000FCC0C4D|nr:hypothetical protein [Campylobacter fetus]RUT50466.1 hypothetical protein BWK67_04565 [Campylobacter fetus]RUT50783.1 hypothetical protein BWK51_04545 [Campylobacter fetus]